MRGEIKIVVQRSRSIKLPQHSKSEELHTLEKNLSKIENSGSTGEKKCIQDLETELEYMTLRHNQCIKQIKSLERTIDFLHTRSMRVGNKDTSISDFKSTYAFRLGDLVIKAFTRPGKHTVFLPFRLLKLVWEYVRLNKTTR